MGDSLGWAERFGGEIPGGKMFGNRFSGRSSSQPANAGEGLAATTTSAELGEPARITRTEPGNLVSSGGGGDAGGASASFRDFFQGRPDDTHPTAPIDTAGLESGEEAARAMARVNAERAGRGRAGTGSSVGSATGPAGGTAFAEVRGSSVPSAGEFDSHGRPVKRSAHWNVTDGDFYTLVAQYLKTQKD